MRAAEELLLNAKLYGLKGGYYVHDDGSRCAAEENLPPTLQSLAYYNGISIRPDPDFHPDMARLVRGIKQRLAAKP